MKKIITAIIIAAVVTALLAVTLRDKNRPPENKVILTEAELEPYLNIKGWKVTLVKTDSVRIPLDTGGKFGVLAAEMRNYGLDLEAHKGETVRRYTYAVDNCGESGVTAELLLTAENELISAALIQLKPDGFIKALH